MTGPSEPSMPERRDGSQGAAGDPAELARLFDLVYDELRVIARRHLSGERMNHTLTATALVHETYLRMLGGPAAAPMDEASRGRFFHAAGEAMRRVLIDHARMRGRVKRGGGLRRESAAPDQLPDDAMGLIERDEPGAILAVDEAFQRLEERDATAGAVVRLRFYAGLSAEETAKAMGISVRTVTREWGYARAVLLKELEKERREEAGGSPGAGVGSDADQ